MGYRFILLCLFISLFAAATHAQNSSEVKLQQATQILQARGEIVFSFHVATKDQINNDLTRIMSIDNVKPAATGGFDVIAYANATEFQTFLSRNIPYEIIPKDVPKALNMATTVAQMATWDRYPTYSVYEQMLANFASTYPTLCDIDTILASTPSGNYKILVARISDNVNTAENEPQFLYSSSMHGDETTGYYLMLRMINYLLTNYGSISQVTNLLNGVEIWICPLANPEGTYYLSSPVGSTVANSRRNNLGNVDLNRNYKDPLDGDHPDGLAWQAETQAFMTFAGNHHFNMAGNFHGGAEVTNYPWDTWTTAGNPNADAAWWERVCTNYVTTARAVTAGYMTDTYTDGVTEGGDWYVITGGRQDYMNYFHQCREVTIELDDVKTTATENLNGMWNTNYQSLLNYMQESMYGIRGIITDSCTGQPIRAKVFANSYDQANDSSHVYSALPVGNYHKYVNTGTYSLTFSAPGYTSKTINNISVTNGTATVVNVALVQPAPVANFAADVTSTCNGTVQFSNTGTYASSSTFLWNFGDGQTSTDENPQHTYASNGTYTVQLTITACAGSDSESKTSYITVNMPAAPTATGATICGSGTATLTASGTNTLNWYSAATGGTLLGTGSSYTTPSISTTTTYYVENNVPATPTNVGPAVGGASRNVAAIEYFDVYAPMTLVSVQAMAGTAGSKNITLLDNTGATVYTSNVNVNTTTTTVTLNWLIQPGTGYQLLTPVNSTLYRIYTGTAYPYTAAGLCAITGCDIGSDYYYSWFNWTVKGAGCSSARVPVTATVQTSTAPTFNAAGPYCVGATPAALSTTSTNGITGTWSPATISTASVGTTTYTFTPTAGQCATTTTMNVVVNATATPSFTALGPYCTGATPAALSTTSTNGIAGTWSPATISTASAGTTTYTFTPTAGQCATTTTMNVVINATATPSFTALGPYCTGATPAALSTTSTNGIAGTWSPATISTASAGTTAYTFTPTAGQCATTATMNVVVNASTTPSFTALGPYCTGSTPAALSITSTNGIAGTWSPATISTASAGTTTYTFTPTAGQCATTTTINVVVNATATPSFTALGPYCEDDTPGTLALTSSNGITGTWSPSAISTASPGTTTYYFTPTAGQCAVNTNMNINVTAKTTPVFTQPGPYCVGATPAVLPSISTNGISGAWSPAVISTASAGTTTYTFTPDAGQCAEAATLNVEVGTNISATFNSFGPYCVGSTPAALPATSLNGITGWWSPAVISTASEGTSTYTFTPDAGQCAGIYTTDIVVTTEIAPTFAAAGPYCVGATPATLQSTSTNGITGTWSPAAISTASAGTTTYTFTPNAGQCATTTTMNVVVNSTATPSFTALGPYCVGGTPATLATTATNGITGTWSPAAISTASAGTTTYTFTPNAGQCATTTTMNVVINATATPSFAALGPYCVGGTPATLATTATNGITGTWSPAAISTASAGTTTYTFTPDAGQCATTTTMNVFVNATTTPSFAALGPYCVGGTPATLAAASTNGITGSWSPAAISTASVGTTTYTFTPDAGQCAEAYSMNVLVDNSISATFNTYGPYCVGATPSTLSSTSNNGITGTWSPAAISTASVGTTTYTFTPNGGQCAGPYTMSVNVTSGTTPPFSVMGPYCLGSTPGILPTTALNGVSGTWSPSVINTSSVGTTMYTFTPNPGQCASNATLSITVNPEYAFTESYSMCSGSSYSWHGMSLTSSGTYTVNHPSMYGCDSTYTLHLTVHPEYSYTENHTICPGSVYNWHGNTYSSAGTYYANYTSQLGCDSVYTLNLSMGQEYAFTDNQTICEGASLMWHGTSYSSAGTYTATYSTISGCDSVYTLNLAVNPLPVVWLGNDTTICADTETLTLDAGNPGAIYLWSENGATSQSIQFTCSGCNAGEYPIWVTVNNGCSASDTINVNIQLCDMIDESGNLIVSAFPNPTNGTLYLSLNNTDEDTDVTITNADGRIVFKGMLQNLNSSAGYKEFDFSEYAAGIYFIQITNTTQVQMIRIVRQ